jgi:two-component system, OmpR family, response regulator
MRLLLVEDDRMIASFVTKGFEQAGFVVDHADNGENGLHLALAESYDAAIIDVMLPRMDGLALIETMRQQGINTPAIILSAKRSLDDKIRGLQIGSDDYLIKPFAFSELLARVHALIRRSSGSVEPARLTVGALSMDLLKRQVTRSGRTVDLQPKEFELLEYLMRHPERVISKTMILEHVWNYTFDPQTNVVDVLVCRLRNKVDRDFEQKMIHTIRGVGYVLKGS